MPCATESSSLAGTRTASSRISTFCPASSPASYSSCRAHSGPARRQPKTFETMFKTLHITNAWHPQSGGIRTFYLALLDAANIAGQFMHLVVPSDSDRVEAIGPHGVIHYVKAPLAPGSKSYRMLFPNHYLWPGSKVHNILRQERPDLVEFCDKYTLTYLGGLLRIGLLPGIDFRPAVVGL